MWVSEPIERGPKAIKEPLGDVQRIRCLNLPCDVESPSSGESTFGDQLHHEGQAETGLDAVTCAKPPECAVVCNAGPAFLATDDQAEAIVERDPGFYLRSTQQLIRFDPNDLNPKLFTLGCREISNFVEDRGQDNNSSDMTRDKLQSRQLGVTVINKHICVREQYCRYDRHLTGPTTNLLPHAFASNFQYLGGAPQRDVSLFERPSYEPR